MINNTYGDDLINSISQQFGEQFLLKLLVDASISIVFFVGGLFFSQVVRRWINVLRANRSMRRNGVTRIYNTQPDDSHVVPAMKKAIESAQKVYVLTVAAGNFINLYYEALKQVLKNGNYLWVLLANPEGPYAKRTQVFEKEDDDYISNMVKNSRSILKELNKSGQHDGQILLRLFSEGMRNPVVICESGSEYKAFLTISLPPLKAQETPMVEFNSEWSKKCYDFFIKVWYDSSTVNYPLSRSEIPHIPAIEPGRNE